MNEHPPVLLEKRGKAFWITLNRPDKRNALNHEVIAGVREGYARAHEDPSVRVIVLTGSGDKAFCAGGDLQPGQAFSFDYSRPSVDYADLLRLAHSAALPSIARVNGICMAGGMGLLCMTDIAVAADSALFGLPEIRIGLFPMQVLSLLQRIAPPRRIREWCLTGEPFSAAEARDAGLLNYVVPSAQLDAKTEWLVERLADKSTAAVRRGKYAMQAIESMTFEQAIAFTEGQIGLIAMTADAQEGLAAFNERRKPEWKGS